MSMQGALPVALIPGDSVLHRIHPLPKMIWVVLYVIVAFMTQNIVVLYSMAALAFLLAIIAVNVYQPMVDAYRFGDLKYDLGVPLYPLYGLIIFAFAASILSCAAALVRELGTGEQ